MNSNLIKGFFRIFVGLFVLAEIVLAFGTMNSVRDANQRFIDPEFFFIEGRSPLLPSQFLQTRATDRYASLSFTERRDEAGRYFDKSIAGLAKEGFYDMGELREIFVRASAEMSDEEPIQQFAPFSDNPNYLIPYKNLPL